MSFFKINEDYNPEEKKKEKTSGEELIEKLGKWKLENLYNEPEEMYMINLIKDLNKRVQLLEAKLDLLTTELELREREKK